jgi:hypothetical protein
MVRAVCCCLATASQTGHLLHVAHAEAGRSSLAHSLPVGGVARTQDIGPAKSFQGTIHLQDERISGREKSNNWVAPHKCTLWASLAPCGVSGYGLYHVAVAATGAVSAKAARPTSCHASNSWTCPPSCMIIICCQQEASCNHYCYCYCCCYCYMVHGSGFA